MSRYNFWLKARNVATVKVFDEADKADFSIRANPRFRQRRNDQCNGKIISMKNQSNPKDDLNAILEILRKIAEKSDSGNYIYRGEPDVMTKCRQAFGVNVRKK